MHNIFNPSRFASLFKKHTLEHFRKNVLSILVLSAIMFSFFLFFVLVSRPASNDWQHAFFVFFILLAISIYACGIFSDLGDKRKAIATLTLPASHLEKFAVSWIYSFIIAPLIFVVVFYMALFAAVNIAAGPKSITIINVFSLRFIWSDFLPIFILLHSFSLLGAIFFQKHHFIKTALAAFISFVALIIVNKQLLKGLIGIDTMSVFPFLGVLFVENDRYYFLDFTANKSLFLYVAFSTVAILLWVTAYFKLKEKQV